MEGELKINQKNHGNNGGKREGAGRPKGSSTRPKITDDLTDEQKLSLIESAYQDAIAGDSRLKVFFLEQIYGKARQNIGLDGGEDGQPIIFMPSEIANKNGINTSTESDSK